MLSDMKKCFAWYAGALMMGICAALAAEEKVNSTQPAAAASQPAAPASEKTAEGCTIEKFTVHSQKMNREIKVAVVLPPAYGQEPSAKFGVLYALHGMDAPYASFT